MSPELAAFLRETFPPEKKQEASAPPPQHTAWRPAFPGDQPPF